VSLDLEARDGIEPPDNASQTLPFSFWVPRRLKHNAKQPFSYNHSVTALPPRKTRRPCKWRIAASMEHRCEPEICINPGATCPVNLVTNK
jgi:hypothetical protein